MKDVLKLLLITAILATAWAYATSAPAAISLRIERPRFGLRITAPPLTAPKHKADKSRVACKGGACDIQPASRRWLWGRWKR